MKIIPIFLIVQPKNRFLALSLIVKQKVIVYVIRPLNCLKFWMLYHYHETYELEFVLEIKHQIDSNTFRLCDQFSHRAGIRADYEPLPRPPLPS